MNRVLITGAGGFLGRALAAQLDDHTRHVVALKRSAGDITVPATLEDIGTVDVVYHLAGRSFVPESWREPAEFLRVNVLGTQQVLEFCVQQGARLVFVSGYVYGVPQTLPISEDHPVNANNPYAVSKYLAEQLCAFHANARDLPVTILRVFNAYGPAQRPEFLIPTIVRQALTSDRICLQQLGPKRDYVYIDDVVNALVRAGSLTTGLNLINIGSGRARSVSEVVATVQAAVGSTLPVEVTGESRVQEIPEVIADCRRAQELLGWIPRYEFEDGIRAVVSAARQAAI